MRVVVQSVRTVAEEIRSCYFRLELTYFCSLRDIKMDGDEKVSQLNLLYGRKFNFPDPSFLSLFHVQIICIFLLFFQELIQK